MGFFPAFNLWRWIWLFPRILRPALFSDCGLLVGKALSCTPLCYTYPRGAKSLLHFVSTSMVLCFHLLLFRLIVLYFLFLLYFPGFSLDLWNTTSRKHKNLTLSSVKSKHKFLFLFCRLKVGWYLCICFENEYNTSFFFSYFFIMLGKEEEKI